MIACTLLQPRSYLFCDKSVSRGLQLVPSVSFGMKPVQNFCFTSILSLNPPSPSLHLGLTGLHGLQTSIEDWRVCQCVQLSVNQCTPQRLRCMCACSDLQFLCYTVAFAVVAHVMCALHHFILLSLYFTITSIYLMNLCLLPYVTMHTL